MALTNKNIVLLETGSFNPPTNMHLRMFEIARDHLTLLGYTVCGGLMSPTHDLYKKSGLVSSSHRCAMIKHSLNALPWVKMSDWEVKQTSWTPTRQVLHYHQNCINTITSSQNNCTRNIDTSFLSPHIIENINLNDLNENRSINVRLLCGGDLLESFAIPGLWKESDVEAIVRDFGLIVVSRSGSNPHKFIYESDLLTKYMANIIIVTEWISNEISSTKVRRALNRNQSVKFLIGDLVESYIKEHGLYGTQNNKCIDDKLDINTSSGFLSPSPVISKTIKTHQTDNNKRSTTKRTNNSNKSKVRNVAENNDNWIRVAIQVSENGIIEVISDKETMV